MCSRHIDLPRLGTRIHVLLLLLLLLLLLQKNSKNAQLQQFDFEGKIKYWLKPLPNQNYWGCSMKKKH